MSKPIAEDPAAATDMDHAACAGSAYRGGLLFGYSITEDRWGIRKHIKMLSFAEPWE